MSATCQKELFRHLDKASDKTNRVHPSSVNGGSKGERSRLEVQGTYSNVRSSFLPSLTFTAEWRRLDGIAEMVGIVIREADSGFMCKTRTTPALLGPKKLC